MAETQTKRQREETHSEQQISDDTTKRHKSYTHILSILEGEEEDTTPQDLNSVFLTLQQELLDDVVLTSTDGDMQQTTAVSSTSGPTSKQEEEDKETMIRHLLEASDDELGIPNRIDGGDEFDEINGRDMSFGLCDGGLWELEDEAANYYTLLQSELFM